VTFASQPFYVVDNTAPQISVTRVPPPNAAGWNNTVPVRLLYGATDPALAGSPSFPGSGVAPGFPAPPQAVLGGDGTFNQVATAQDLVNNVAQVFTVVKIDTTAPTITGSRSPAANSFGWNNGNVSASFTCADPNPAIASGIKSCTGPVVLSANAANQSAIGTATDNADNSTSTTVGPINIDKVAPLLSGFPATAPNANGWYNNSVPVIWNFSDALSGIDPSSVPPPAIIPGEGVGQTTSATVKDQAGNITTAVSAPAVRIDRTFPNTQAAASPFWNNTNVTVHLVAGDNLSGVANTNYRLDGAPQASGADVPVTGDGVHSLEFWSVDMAGNEEPHHLINVLIDQTPPTINHTQAPMANANGWNNSDVVLTFQCADATSGIASCAGVANATTANVPVTTEGKDQAFTRSAVDNAGNSATDPATVSIDKTAPTISGGFSPAANAYGWNNSDVAVHFDCSDGLSGVADCTSDSVLGSEGANQSVLGSVEDAAGNGASASVGPVNIDKTAPTISGGPSTAPNANGWYNGDVQIDWNASDALSGLDAMPASHILSGEGENLGASSTVLDKAGNQATSSITGINIDRTVPSIMASVVNGTQVDGWYNGPVTVHFDCYDGLSGLAAGACPADVTLSGDGANQQVSGSVTDLAGNSASATVSDIDIDATAPSISGAPTTAPNANGWYNSPVTMHFTCSDGLSGVPAGGCPDDVTLSGDGADQQVVASVADAAGNSASATVSNIDIDRTAPTITGAPTTSPGPGGWYGGPVTVHFTCSDALSGLAVGACPADVTISTDGENQSVTRSVSDLAGNSASATVSGINILTVPPSITGSASPAPNANGWNNSNVTVHFTCVGSLPIVGGCPADVVLSSDGAGQTVNRTITDTAGHSASVTVGPINIDKTAPALTLPANISTNASGLSGAVVTYSGASASDALSGFAGGNTTTPTCSPASGSTFAAGSTTTVHCSATDRAGNTVNGTFTVSVNRFYFQGFFQPIDNLPVVNLINAGRTVPVKWKLFLYQGGPAITDIASVAAGWPRYSTMTCDTNQQISEVETTSSGNTELRYDAGSQQFIYNWKTPSTANVCLRLDVKFVDGQLQSANFKLR
jgi:hypothetical protein